MKTFEIQIQSKAEADREFIEAFKNAQAGKKVPAKIGVYFTSIESVRNLLTEKRLELLHMVKMKHPHSIYQLAKLTGRNFRNVYDDVQVLKTYGLIHLNKERRKKQRPSHSISVPYRDINIHAWI
ncbi:MAG: hypothetical protein A3A86_05750 [Elusimicrobia bacterium RIFCSPLOWO2_01_FULL_60_11]|nr:MAG: hypothetical protein A3A86_05750 [Elusimicrobia bacterium RIFCSPLOWO2_01_FULL_60_11]